jgi:Protein of unknown function (DUF3383)
MGASIPASALVNIVPGVIGAGGSALQTIGLFLTQNTRVPVGTVASYPSAAAVSAAFGGSSTEAAAASIYFGGFSTSTAKPGAMLLTQYPSIAVPAYLRGASVAALTLAQLQALSGSLTVLVDGATQTAASINLSSATSFSNAAALIATAFSAYDGVTANTTTIAAASSTTGTASITGNVMNATAVTGTLVVGGVISGTGITTGTTIVSQITGIAGGVGTYQVSAIQNVTSTAISQSAGLMTVSGSMASGFLAVGQIIVGSGVLPGTTITALGTGTGAAGTYYTSGGAQSVSATTISAGALACAYDSVSGAFVLTGGTPGTQGSIGFATGTLAASLNLTSATGAVTSQGAASATPAAFMNAVIAATTNWASFMTLFDPDGGYGNTQKQAFAKWAAGAVAANNYAYICWDTDVSPTLSSNATSSLGNILEATEVSGTCPIYSVDYTIAAFVCGAIASLDFNRTNGRIAFAYKSGSGLTPTVTNQTVANNLAANGYNYYGAWATATQQFIGFAPGTVTGPFEWLDSFIDQIWLNNSFQSAFMNLLFNVNSLPYNTTGYALVRNTAVGTPDAPGPILAGLNFGAFAGGVPLSASQVAQVNNAAGTRIDDVLSANGWYLQILPATPSARATRSTPPMTFWYNDAGSIQQITMASIEVE